MIRTFEALRAVEPGFAEPESLQTFRIAIPPSLVPDPRARLAHAERRSRMRSRRFPASTRRVHERAADGRRDVTTGTARRRGRRRASERRRRCACSITSRRATSRTMGMSLVAGRDLESGRRRRAAPRGARLRDARARALADAGRRARPANPGAGGGPWREVVGVVADVRDERPRCSRRRRPSTGRR